MLWAGGVYAVVYWPIQSETANFLPSLMIYVYMYVWWLASFIRWFGIRIHGTAFPFYRHARNWVLAKWREAVAVGSGKLFIFPREWRKRNC